MLLNLSEASVLCAQLEAASRDERERFQYLDEPTDEAEIRLYQRLNANRVNLCKFLTTNVG